MPAVFLNHPRRAARAHSVQASQLFGASVAREVLNALTACPAYSPTPLVALRESAALLGVSEVWAKDERNRLGLASFKALGGAYAVLTHATRHASREGLEGLGIRELLRQHRPMPLTFATATAGNHGRSVAAGASMVGARSVVFVPEGVPDSQVAAIVRSGAEIVHVAGTYDRAVQECRDQVAREGWTLVLDTSFPGYIEIPRRVMQGYVVILAEALEQLPHPPTHVIVQAGVGGLAAATAAYLANGASHSAPRTIVVEPDRAACLLESARAGKPVKIPSSGRTNMGRLECYEPSLLAWEILSGLAAAFVTVSDTEATRAEERLAHESLPTSPSGAAGLAGLFRLTESERSRTALGLGPESRVLVLVTEQKP